MPGRRNFVRIWAVAGCWGLALLFASLPDAFAHDFWIESSGKDLVLVFGHGDQREEFDVSRVKSVKASSAEGKEIDVRRVKKGKGLLLQPVEPPSWIYAQIDNGYWSKTIYGWKNLPKRKASRAVEAERSLSCSKVLLSWSKALEKPMEGVRLDIVLLKNPFELKSGDLLPIQVFYGGKPISGVEIEGRDHKIISATDREGKADLRIAKGPQLISASYREPLKDDPDADYLHCTAALTFEVGK